VTRSEDDFSLQVQQHPFADNGQPVRDEIISYSRKRYATKIEALHNQEFAATAATVEPGIPQPQQQEQADISKELPVPETPVRTPTLAKKQPKKNDDSSDAIKEQTEHRSLQNLIKLMAESRGYKASLEIPTVDKGKVDVVLQKDGMRIACEISVTTDVTWELHNIQKCLKDNFTYVISISKNEPFLAGLRKKVLDTCTATDQQKVYLFLPEQWLAF